jgi:ketosteroid isomerase-like protein
MMYWLTEDSFVPMLTGIFVAVVLLLMAWSARNKVVMFVALFIAAATAAIVATEMAIVTDRETVTDMVYQLARHVRANDTEAIASHISPQAPAIEARMKSQMSRFKVEACTIVGINEFSSEGNSATVDFVAWGQGSERRGGLEGAANPRVTLELRKQDDESWKIMGYSISNPRADFSL